MPTGPLLAPVEETAEVLGEADFPLWPLEVHLAHLNKRLGGESLASVEELLSLREANRPSIRWEVDRRVGLARCFKR